MTQQPPSKNPQDFSVEHKTQQIVQTNHGQVIARVENLYVYYSTPRTVEPTPQTVDASNIGPNPYRGLRAFREEDHAFFFGRRQQTDTLWKTLKALYDHPSAIRFLPVYGPSGSGKSSLVRAGLLPVIGQRSLSSQEHTRVAILEPRTQPLQGLALALARMATGKDSPVAKAREFYRELQQRNDQGRYDGLWRIVRSLPGTEFSPVIVAVDQFEEIYSQCKDKRQQLIFINNLLTAAADQSRLVIVVVTLRSDFLGETQAHALLNRLFSKHGYLVPAMNEVELRQAISKPAEKAGHLLDAATVTLLIQETQQREGALPLLQVALSDIWNGLRDGKEPGQTLQEIGGVGGALAKKAETIFQALTPEQQTIARRVFLGVIQLGDGIRDTRRRAQVSSLVAQQTTVAQLREVIEQFAWREARLLTLAANNAGNETVEVTHEALIEHWRRLNEWLEESREDIRFQRRLEEAVHNWKVKKQSEGLLWRPPDLDLLQGFEARAKQDMTPGQVAFTQASTKAEFRRKRIRRFGISGLIVGLLVTTFSSVIAVQNAKLANQRQQETSLQNANTLIQASLALDASNQKLNAIVALLRANKYIKDNQFTDSEISHEAKGAAYNILQTVGEVSRFDNHRGDGWLRSFKFSADGKTIASMAGSTVWIWKSDGTPVRKITLPIRNSFSSDPMALSPDGQTLAIVKPVSVEDIHNEITLYNIKGEIINKFSNPPEFVKRLRFSPNGENLVLEFDNGIAELRTVEGILTAKLEDSLGLEFSPDGRIVASLNSKGLVELRRLGGDVIRTIKPQNVTSADSQINTIRFSPDNQNIAFWADSKVVEVWGIDGNLKMQLNVGSSILDAGFVSSASTTTDGYIFATVSVDGLVRTWKADGNSNSTFRIALPEKLNMAMFSPDGYSLVSLNSNYKEKTEITLWNIIDGIQVKSLTPDAIWIPIAFSPDSQILIIEDNDNIFRVIRLRDDQLAIKFDGEAPYHRGFQLSPNGQTVAYWGGDVIEIWKTNGEHAYTLETDTGSIEALEFSPNSKMLLSFSDEKFIHLWDVNEGSLLQEIQLEASQAEDANSDAVLTFSPDGQLFALGKGDGILTLWDLDGKELNRLTGHQKAINQAQFSPDGHFLASASRDNTVRLWNRTGLLIKVIEDHEDGFQASVNDLKFSREGDFFVTAGDDGTLRLWDMDGSSLGTLGNNLGSIKKVEFSPDGKLLASVTYNLIHIWDMDNRKHLATLEGHLEWITDIDFSPDGQILASSSSTGGGNSEDDTIRLWKIDGTPLSKLNFNNPGQVYAVQFSSDGQFLVTASIDGIGRIWPWNLDELAWKACSYIKGYLENNPTVESDDRVLCDTFDTLLP